MSRIAAVVVLAFVALFGVASAQKEGWIGTYQFNSAVEGRAYRVNIYYPPGFNCSGWKYPIIYLLHGHSGTELDWVIPAKGDIVPTANRIFTTGGVKSAVLVIPGDQFSWWVDTSYRKAETAFITELVPWVENSLLAGRVINERRGRMIGGLSAGGYGAIRFCMLYPNMWISAAPLSPAIYAPLPTAGSSALGAQGPFKGSNGQFNASFWMQLNWPSYIDKYISRGWGSLHPMYLNSGDYDRFRIAYHTANFFNELWNRQSNITKINKFRVVDGDHDWPVWRSTIGEAMTFMLGYSSAPEMAAGMSQMDGDGPGCKNPPPPPPTETSSTGNGCPQLSAASGVAAPTLAVALLAAAATVALLLA